MALSGDEELPIQYDEDEDGDRVVQHLGDSADRISVLGCPAWPVMLDPRNEVVDPDADRLEMHPKFDAAAKDAERYRLLRRGALERD